MKPKMTVLEKRLFDFLRRNTNEWFTAKILWIHNFAITQRGVRSIIQSLRLVHGKTIASSHLGYCYTSKKEPLKKTAGFIRRHALLELKTANAIDKQADHEQLARQLELSLLTDEPPEKIKEMATQLWRLNIEYKYAVKILEKTYGISNNVAKNMMNTAWNETQKEDD